MTTAPLAERRSPPTSGSPFDVQVEDAPDLAVNPAVVQLLLGEEGPLGQGADVG
jgi:hypothetical protein